MPYCPTRDEVFDTLLALLPRGRAWQTHDASIPTAESVLKSFFYALSGPIYDLEVAICAQFDEIFAATATTSLDLWFEDYGLPDDCDPFGDNLIEKVKTRGGSSIQYYQDLIAALGWIATLRWLRGNDPDFPGVISTLYVAVDASSPAFGVLPRVGIATVGVSNLGAFDVSLLTCTLDRIVPAHCEVIVEVV